ncbi:MAG: hypothetical protein ACKVP2_04450 [Burkholderiales bacterium]
MKFINQLLQQHVTRYPASQLVDIYKLLHQAALGPGHAVSDSATALKRLKDEVSNMQGGPQDPLDDVISPDGRLARIHLRPFLAAGGDIEDLHRAFVDTAAGYAPTPGKLEKFCACLGDLAGSGNLPFEKTRVIEFFDDIARSGYPVMRHSDDYRLAYRPAYRVVAVDLLKR